MADSGSAREAARPQAARDLGELIRHKFEESGFRSQAQLARAVPVGDSSVSALFNAERRISWNTVRGIAARLDDSREWLARVLECWQAAERGWDAANGRSGDAETEWRRIRFAALPDKPKPVREWRPNQLAIHDAIHDGMTREQLDAGEYALPSYVARTHDKRIAARVEVARNGGAALVLQVGGSCTGKSRSAYEAVKELDDWNLVYPKTLDSLMAVLDAEAIEPKTVLWLDDGLRYLLGRKGEAAAAGLRRCLEEVGSILVMVSAWPVVYSEIIDTTGASASDSRANVRSLLASSAPVFVPPRFDGTEIVAARAAARTDKALAAGLAGCGSSGELTQVLACGTDLVNRYLTLAHTDPRSHALLTAAMDAYAAGCRSPLALELLCDSLEGYLDPEDRAVGDNWLEQALTVITRKLKDVAAPMTPVRGGAGFGPPDGYQLAEYLAQYATTSRLKLHIPPQSLWDSLAMHIREPITLRDLASNAVGRGLYREAVTLRRIAAELGDHDDLIPLCVLLKRAGHHDEMERWLRLAISTRQSSLALRRLTEFLDDSARSDEIEPLLRDAVDQGISGSTRKLAEFLDQHGREDEAREYWSMVDAGDPGEMCTLGEITGFGNDMHRREQTIAMLRRKAATGDLDAISSLGTLLAKSGEYDEAEALLRSVASTEYANWFFLVWILIQTDRIDDVDPLLRAAVEAGSLEALSTWARFVRESGRPNCAPEVIELLKANCDTDTNMAAELVSTFTELGRATEAADFLAQRAEEGETGHIERLFAVLILLERHEEALDWIKRGCAAGDIWSLTEYAKLLEMSDSSELAETLRRAAVSLGGGRDAIEQLADLLARLGRDEEAARVRNFGLRPDGATAEPW
ncbi:hypothetical protein [Nocardia gipuzkoensis]